MTILYVVYVITIWLLHINFITKYVILSIGNNGFWVINLAFYKRIRDLREDHDMTQQQAKNLLASAVSCGAISAKEGTLIMSAVSDRALAKVEPDIRSVVRADILKNAILALIIT